MKKYFNVSYQYSETVYCSNIVHAETAEDIRQYYSEYNWCDVSEASEFDVEDAKRRNKPIIEIEPTEDKKMYISEKDLKPYEKQTGRVSYATAVDRFCGPILLCNDIVNVDPDIWCNIVCGDLWTTDDDTEDEGEMCDVYQYYLCHLNEYDIERLHEYGDPLIIAYSEKLDLYVLMVTHFGTLWDYVTTDIKHTQSWEDIYNVENK